MRPLRGLQEENDQLKTENERLLLLVQQLIQENERLKYENEIYKLARANYTYKRWAEIFGEIVEFTATYLDLSSLVSLASVSHHQHTIIHQHVQNRKVMRAHLPMLVWGESETRTIGKSEVTASGSYAPAERLKFGKSWNAGAHPIQWVLIDFGGDYVVHKVSLTVDQESAGPTLHEIHAGSTSTTMKRIHKFQQNTRVGEVLITEFSPPKYCRYIKVYTTSSPSWVAWKKIMVALKRF